MTTNVDAVRRIEYVPIDDIIGADRNPKGHDEALIEASMRRFGYTEPAVMDERTGKLVAGHGRVEQLRTMRERGDDPPEGVPANDGRWLMPVLRGWSSTNDREAQAYLIASNRITERGGWDRESLLTALDSLEGELAGVGFNQSDIDGLQERLNETSSDVEWDDNEPHDEHDPTGQRTLSLDYDLATFERVVEMAQSCRSKFSVLSNADLFRAMLEREVGQ